MEFYREWTGIKIGDHGGDLVSASPIVFYPISQNEIIFSNHGAMGPAENNARIVTEPGSGDPICAGNGALSKTDDLEFGGTNRRNAYQHHQLTLIEIGLGHGAAIAMDVEGLRCFVAF
jgi:hypothetical protein